MACVSVAFPAAVAPATAPAAAAAPASARVASTVAMGLFGGFEIDGNTTVDGTGLDWDTTGQHLVDGADDPTQYKNPKDFDNHPSTWQAADAVAPQKDDFTDAWVHTATLNGEVFAYFAFQRAATQGTVNYDIEFNQLDNMPGLPARPVRSVNDLMLDVQQGGNGDFQIVHAYLWTLKSSPDWGANCTEVSGYSPGAGWCEVPVPASAFEGAISGDKIFGEGSLNLSMLFPAGTCSNDYGTINMRSRTSDSPNASLKDYVAADVSVPSTCGKLTINKRDPQGAPAPGATFQISPDPTPGSAAATLTVTDGGAGDDDGAADGVIVIDPVEPGTYTVTETAPPTGMLLPPPADRTQQVTVDEAESVTVNFADPHKWLPPTLTKTAEASYAARYDWTITKTVDQAAWHVPDGTTAKPTYTVTVTAGPEQTSDYRVVGELSITNPNPRPMVVTVTDLLADNTACTVAGTDADAGAPGEQRTLAAGPTTLGYTCTYAQAPGSPSGTNTATLTWSRADYPQQQSDANDPANAPQGSAVATKDYTFARTSRTDETVDVTDTRQGALGTLSWDDVWAMTDHQKVFTYQLELAGEPGECTTYDNTAALTEKDTPTTRDDDASVEVCVGLDLTVEKTVAVAYDRTYNWSLDKTGPASVFVGDDGKTTVDYQIDVQALPTTDSAPILDGTITVENPNDWDVTADVADVFTLNGDDVTCTVTGGDDAVVPKNGTLDLDYTCTIDAGSWPDNYHGTNRVTVTWDKATYFSPTGSATYDNAVEDSETTETPAHKDIDLVDAITEAGGNPVAVTLSPSSLNWVDVWNETGHTVTIDAQVQLDTGLAAGACTTYDNVVSITGTQISDTATTEVCRPEITKTVKAEYGRTYRWTLDKTVDEDSVEIGPDGSATFHYGVTATPDGFTDGTASWTGTITVENPSATKALDTTITDVSGVAGWTCTITGDPAVTVDPGDTTVVPYTCAGDVTTHPSGTNTATATFGGKTVTTEVPVSFAKVTDVDKTITVTDPKAPNTTLGNADWGDGTQATTFEYDWTAPAGTLGVCETYDNTATITETGQNATEKVEVCREAPLEVTKTAAGSYDRTYHWKIAKAADETSVEIRDGQSHDFHYTVDVTKDGYADSGWEAHGTITVHNPNAYADGAIVADVTDDLSGVTGGVCTVTGGTDVELAPGATEELGYACTFGAEPAAYTGTNTATASWTDPDDEDATATGTAPLTLQVDDEIDKSIDVVDDKTEPGASHPLGTSTWDAGPFSYTYTVTKSGVAGTCTTYDNTATIVQAEQSADESVELCVVRTPAAAAAFAGDFDRSYAWAITKEADQTQLQAGVDGKANAHYVVAAIPGAATDSGWTASGSVQVTNPNDFKDVSAGVSVTLDVDAPATCVATGSPVTVPAGQTVAVPITCTFPDSGYADGTATVSIAWAAGSPVVTQVPVAFVLDTETNRTVTVTDDKAGTVGAPATLGTADWNAGGQPTLFDYTLPLSAVPGQCQTWTNTATIVETKQSAGEQVQVCMPGQVGGIELSMQASVKTACVTRRYGEALVTAVNPITSSIPGTVRVRVGKKVRGTAQVQPGQTREIHLTGLRIGKVVRVVMDGGAVLAKAKVKGGCKVKAVAPTTGVRQAAWDGGRLSVPSTGISAQLRATATPRVPLNRNALGQAFFWRGDGEPGGPGSVLVALHSNRSGWAAGNRLPKLRKGATVQVELGSGKVLTYRVTRSIARAPLNLSEKRMAELQSNLGPSQLVLTTCNRWALDGSGRYRYRSLAYLKLID
ncbi:sortase [Nocardioides sp. QY071]|uniref:sortase domain-containing protein n=1 Tax=Nocardioides sp. QY071 TaxID=3044187 RepID=UPI00249C9C81|nr:sortase [Nocardioides sp. QY071]WGY02688.1 sortase [Nocardioides sp. QY071]